MIIGSSTPKVPTAMVVAHPGHEVRVHAWLELTQPQIFILTDGSGHSAHSRLPATSNLLAGLQVPCGDIYGDYSERAFYNAVLNQDLTVFIALAEKLAKAFKRAGIERVVGDAAEGYNSTHDVCRLIVNAAVDMVNSNGSQVENYDFPVVGNPDSCPEEMNDKAMWVYLDDAAFDRKLNAAKKYYPELLEEVHHAFNGNGGGPLGRFIQERDPDLKKRANGHVLDLFRVECLRPIKDSDHYKQRFPQPPFYEKHGEDQRNAGVYQQVIRVKDHLVPIAESLRSHVAGRA